MNQDRFKFRVWNGEQMVSPDYITRDGCAHWKEDSIPNSSNKLMQCTGIKDMEGNLVYEGDVIQVRGGETAQGFREVDLTGEVVWSYTAFYLKVGEIHYDFSIMDYDTVYIIKNIYDTGSIG